MTAGAFPNRYNIGVLYFYGHAMPAADEMMGAWVSAVQDPRGSGGLANWDQDPINKRVRRA
jgi:hypothetical protein